MGSANGTFDFVLDDDNVTSLENGGTYDLSVDVVNTSTQTVNATTSSTVYTFGVDSDNTTDQSVAADRQVEVANLNFSSSNVSDVDVDLNGTGASDLDPGEIQEITVTEYDATGAFIADTTVDYTQHGVNVGLQEPENVSVLQVTALTGTSISQNTQIDANVTFNINPSHTVDTNGVQTANVGSNSATITGDVRTSNNEILDGATVSVYNKDTNILVTNLTTDSTGTYTGNLGGGANYSVNITAAPGYDLNNYDQRDTSSSLLIPQGETGRIDIRLDRILRPDNLEVIDVSPADTVVADNESMITVTLNLTHQDGGPLGGEAIDASVGSNTVFFDGATSKTTGTNGQVEFTVYSNESQDATLNFEVASDTSVSASQGVTFTPVLQDGNGAITGDVKALSEEVSEGLGVQSDNAEAAANINVHAVQSSRLSANTVQLNVSADSTDHVRVWNNDTSSYLDVQTDYLFRSSQGEADLQQNLTIEGTGFDATNASGGNYTVHVLEPGNYTVQVSADGTFTNPVETDFEATNDLTYDAVYERYQNSSQTSAVPTDVTGEDGEFTLQNLYTNGSVGADYVVIAGDSNGAYGFANGQAYQQITVEQSATAQQLEQALNIAPVEISADSVDIENVGTVPSADDADANYEDALEPFSDTSDDVRQEIPRDNATVDVITVRSFLGEDNTTVGANVTLDFTSENAFDGEFLNTAVNGEVISHSADQIKINTGDGEAVVFLQTDKASLNTDTNVTVNANVENAAGDDYTDKKFVGVLDQQYKSGSVTGVVSDANDNPVDARIYVSELSDNAAGISITFEPDSENLEDFTATVYDAPTPANGNKVEDVSLTADQMRNFEFQGFNSQLTLAENQSEFELLADRAADRTTLSPVPAVDDPAGVDLSLTGVATESGATGTSVSTAIEVDRTSTGSIVIVEAETSYFQVSDLSPEEYTAGAEESFTVGATVTNAGDVSDTKDVELRLDGNTVATQSVQLDAGTSQNVEFDVDASDLSAGNYTHSVWTEDSEASGTLTVEEMQTSATFEVSNVDAPDNVTAGDSMTVTAEIENTGDVAGEQPVMYILGNEVINITEPVQLDPGASTTVEFNVDTTDVPAGDYTHGVYTDADEVETSITVEEATSQNPTVVGDQPATDTTGDGVLNDVNGDGQFTASDVQALFANQDSDAVQNNPASFDFNGDGSFTVSDVQALFAQL